MLLPDDDFPNFVADTTIGEIDLYDYIDDSWCILLSHPLDFTPVCTTELAEAIKLLPEFKKRNVKLLSLSCSTIDKHLEWINDIKTFIGLDESAEFPIPIISDSNRFISVKLGMIRAQDIDKQNFPLTVRHCFIISPDKKMKLAVIYPDCTGRNFFELLRTIDSLKLAARKQLCTPSDWQPGEKCLVLPTVNPDEIDILYPQGVDTIMVPSGKHYLRMTDVVDY